MATNPQITAKALLDATPLKKSLKKSEGAVSKFAGKASKQIGTIFKGAGIGFAGLGAGIGATFAKGLQSNIRKENTQILLKSLLGGKEEAAAAMKVIEDTVKKSPMFSRADTQTAFTALAPFSDKDLGKLQRLVALSQKLSLANPEQGLEGAAFAIKEALGGDYQSLIERFNLSRTKINELKEAGLEGEQIINRMLSAMGISDETLNDFSNSTTGMVQALKNEFDGLAAQLAEGLFKDLGPKLAELQKYLKEHKETISNIAQGTADAMTAAVKAIAAVADVTAVTAAGIGGGIEAWQDDPNKDFAGAGKAFAGQMWGTAKAGAGLVNAGVWKVISHIANPLDGWEFADKMAAEQANFASRAWAEATALDDVINAKTGNDAFNRGMSGKSAEAAGNLLPANQAQLGSRSQQVQGAIAAGQPIPPLVKMQVTNGNNIPTAMGAGS